MLTNDMDSLPLKNIPQIWLIRRREYLETHCLELTELQQELTMLSTNQDITDILDAIKSINGILEHVTQIDEKLNDIQASSNSGHHDRKINELKRIEELAFATKAQLQAAATQRSWGKTSDKQFSQINRNLYPLIRLLNSTLSWLNEVAQ